MSEAPPAPEKLLRRHLAVVRQTGEGDVLMAVVTDDEGRSALPYVDTPWIYPADVRGIEDALAPQLRLSHLIGFGIVWVALIIFAAESYFANRVPAQPIPELGEG